MWWFFLTCILSKISLHSSQSLPLLLLVSFDGFRFDYPQRYGPLGNFSRLAQRGVHVHSMIPTFSTATLPNQYTLITGLYEEVHGLIADQIYDPKTGNVFQFGENMTNQPWPIKPIWTINEQRANARSGVIGWLQDSMNISRFQTDSLSQSSQSIIDRMLGWLTDSDEGINFGAIYFREPGLTGRRTGPNSNELKQILQKCDDDLGYLLNKIEQDIQLKNNLHLIVTSTHGMEQINSTNEPNFLEDYIDTNQIKAFGSETLWNIFLPSLNNIDEIRKNLTKIPHAIVYKKSDILDRYHYQNHRHIGDLIIILDSGYELHRRASFQSGKTIAWNTTHGNHGYDNQIDSMKTIFYAIGPQLKENFTLPNTSSLFNVDIFALMCVILNIDKCPPSNSSWKNIQPFLVDPNRISSLIDKDMEKLHDGVMGLVIYLLVLVSFVLILIMAVVWTAVSYRNASAIARAIHHDATIIAEQNQYKFTQINDLRLNPAIGDENL